MEVTVLTEQRKAAVDLDQRIKTTAKTFTEDFIQLCRLLDEMCSKKLYKEFGYQTFYDYCDKEIGLRIYSLVRVSCENPHIGYKPQIEEYIRWCVCRAN